MCVQALVFCFLKQKTKAWTNNQLHEEPWKPNSGFYSTFPVWPWPESRVANTLAIHVPATKKDDTLFGDDPHSGTMILSSSHSLKQWGRPGENHGVGKQKAFTNGAVSSTAVAKSHSATKLNRKSGFHKTFCVCPCCTNNMGISKSFIMVTRTRIELVLQPWKGTILILNMFGLNSRLI